MLKSRKIENIKLPMFFMENYEDDGEYSTIVIKRIANVLKTLWLIMFFQFIKGF